MVARKYACERALETRRSQGYLRAYLRIAGNMPLYAGGILLDKKRLWQISHEPVRA